jgi:hypothetical protein
MKNSGTNPPSCAYYKKQQVASEHGSSKSFPNIGEQEKGEEESATSFPKQKFPQLRTIQIPENQGRSSQKCKV